MNADKDYPAVPTTFRLDSAFRPHADNRAFRDAMASFASTACLITARRGEQRLGRTVTSVFSLSVDPPSILVSVDIKSELAEAIREGYGFSLAMLSQSQRAVADAFAGGLEPEKRFEEGRWTSWASGHPRLADAVVSMDCDLVGAMETETHSLFAGGVMDLEINDTVSPLIWHRRDYAQAVPLRPVPVA